MGNLNKYLFLDIDGVICTKRALCRTMANYFDMDFHEEYWTDPELQEEKKDEMDDIFQARLDAKDHEVPSWSMSNWPMDRIAIDNLNEIVEKTKCEVILSSTWRYTEGLKGTERILRENGFNYHLKGKTPTDLITSERGREIQHWLDNNTDDDYDYVIIDDDWQDIYGHHPDNLVVTNFDTGLADVKKSLCLTILDNDVIHT